MITIATSVTKRAKSDTRKVLHKPLEFDNKSLEQTVAYCSGILTLVIKNRSKSQPIRHRPELSKFPDMRI